MADSTRAAPGQVCPPAPDEKPVLTILSSKVWLSAFIALTDRATLARSGGDHQIQVDQMNVITRTSRVRKVLCVSLLVAAVSGGVAQAASVSTTGSRASNVGSTLTVTDTKAEGDNAYANWNSNSANRITTSGGLNSTNSITTALTNFRACRDQGSFNPDNCSSYVSP